VPVCSPLRIIVIIMSTPFVSVIVAILLVVCIGIQCRAAPLGTVTAQLFTDAKCTQSYLDYGLMTENNVALDGSGCQNVLLPNKEPYANIITCSDIGSQQYYYEQYWPNNTWCNGAPLMTFTHVAPRGVCSALHWTYNNTFTTPPQMDLPSLYAQLTCTPYVAKSDSNSASHTSSGTIVAAIAAAASVLLLSIV